MLRERFNFEMHVTQNYIHVRVEKAVERSLKTSMTIKGIVSERDEMSSQTKLCQIHTYNVRGENESQSGVVDINMEKDS